ncbi:hypothetical protein DMA11_21555 [Marinilabiliaceae bacterium JC017]|nr:hypothetical protein DMA11_21555 [Marinilabiliaceae bacterium JC017]
MNCNPNLNVMKRVRLFFAVAIIAMFGINTLQAANPKKMDIKDMQKVMSRCLYKTMNGSDFMEILETGEKATVKVLCRVDKNCRVTLLNAECDHVAMKKCVEETLNEHEIKICPDLKGRVFEVELLFIKRRR